MAKPPSLSLKIEDYGALLEDYPEFEKLIRAFNQFSTGVTASLNRGTTFADNIASQEAALTFDTDGTSAIVYPGGKTTLRIALKLPQGIKAKHVTITQAVTIDTTTRQETPVTVSGPAWSLSGSDLLISGVGNLSASKRYRVTLLIVGG